MSNNKNVNPKVISGSDAKVEGQLQIEDSLVLDPKVGGSGTFVIVTADDDGLEIGGAPVVTLQEDGTIDSAQLPNVGLVSVSTVASEEAQLDLEAEEGDVAIRSDEGPTAYMHNGGTSGTISDWTAISFISVSSVAGQTGEVTLELSDLTDWDATDYAAASHTHEVADITDFDPGDKADAAHSHTKADITDLDESDYAEASHSHTKADITDLDETDYAAASHTHVVADITDFSPGDKANTIHSHTKADITDLDESDYAAASHTHTKSEITDFALGRNTLTQTISVAESAEASVSLPLATAFGLWKISTNKAARIRLYSTAADRTADESRNEGDPPAAGTGLITEVITTGALLSLPLTPPQFGASLETTPSSNISALIENKGSGADVEITITWTPLA